MEDNAQFIQQLQSALNQKQNWFNTVSLPEVLGQYRLLSSCVRNLYDMLKKKALVTPDPYSVDKRISEIVVPATDPFPDNEVSSVLGERLSDYDAMLDFISNYFRFSVENMPSATIKKLIEFNNVFEWSNISLNNLKANSHGLALLLNQARINAPAILISMINDCIIKGTEATDIINKNLVELAAFQKELYKGQIRNDLFTHPEFNKEKAFQSQDAELAEIKRLYGKVIGKKVFYTDLINEIIQEDLGADKEKLRAAVLQRLEIREVAVKKEVKRRGPDTQGILIDTIMAIGGLAPTMDLLRGKLVDNFGVFYSNKTSFFKKLMAALRVAFHRAPRDKHCTIKIVDAKTSTTREEKININDFLAELSQKVRVYNGIAAQGVEYQKLTQYPEEKIYNFVCKQISECQTIYTIINGLDSFFKTEVDIINRPKIKGLQIDLSAMRNSIIAANKKRGEYQSLKEESVQMGKLGI